MRRSRIGILLVVACNFGLPSVRLVDGGGQPIGLEPYPVGAAIRVEVLTDGDPNDLTLELTNPAVTEWSATDERVVMVRPGHSEAVVYTRGGNVAAREPIEVRAIDRVEGVLRIGWVLFDEPVSYTDPMVEGGLRSIELTLHGRGTRLRGIPPLSSVGPGSLYREFQRVQLSLAPTEPTEEAVLHIGDFEHTFELEARPPASVELREIESVDGLPFVFASYRDTSGGALTGYREMLASVDGAEFEPAYFLIGTTAEREPGSPETQRIEIQDGDLVATLTVPNRGYAPSR